MLSWILFWPSLLVLIGITVLLRNTHAVLTAASAGSKGELVCPS